MSYARWKRSAAPAKSFAPNSLWPSALSAVASDFGSAPATAVSATSATAAARIERDMSYLDGGGRLSINGGSDGGGRSSTSGMPLLGGGFRGRAGALVRCDDGGGGAASIAMTGDGA